MKRSALLLVGLVAAVALAVAARAGVAADDPTYAHANALLARAVPQYPRARRLEQQAVNGEVGLDSPAPRTFEAVQRVSFLARPQSQRRVMGFYAGKLGWRQQGPYCLVSGSRLVVAYVYTRKRLLALLIDSRGRRTCRDLVGLVSDYVDAAYGGRE